MNILKLISILIVIGVSRTDMSNYVYGMFHSTLSKTHFKLKIDQYYRLDRLIVSLCIPEEFVSLLNKNYVKLIITIIFKF